ncbi:hypothetical protein THIOKS1990008 [Thiocapsa sp. KS1]|nr:hypothetical protein THIOKS1990008 [Thiocapsa sp. KS1]
MRQVPAVDSPELRRVIENAITAHFGPKTDPEALMTTSDVAEHIGRSKMTLFRWRRAGILPEPIKIRGTLYWRRKAVIDAIAEYERKSIAEASGIAA